MQKYTVPRGSLPCADLRAQSRRHANGQESCRNSSRLQMTSIKPNPQSQIPLALNKRDFLQIHTMRLKGYSSNHTSNDQKSKDSAPDSPNCAVLTPGKAPRPSLLLFSSLFLVISDQSVQLCAYQPLSRSRFSFVILLSSSVRNSHHDPW